jgi:hypothetical protein
MENWQEVIAEVEEDVAENTGSGGLIRAALGSCSCDDNENIEDDTERGDAEDNRSDGNINLPKIASECTTEK